MLPTLVLTAGLGKRLDPLTRLLAKPAMPVAGRALIERVLDWLRREGVRDVVLNLHHRPETITGIVGDGSHLGVSVRYSWEPQILGSAGGPRRALSLLDADTFVIVNGDTLCDLDLVRMVDAHERSRADVTMAVVPNRAPDHYNGVLVDADDRVRGFVPKGSSPPQATWHFIGVQVVRASVFAQLADGAPEETVAGLYRARVTAQVGSIRAWRTDATFFDVGTPRDYLRAVLQIGHAEPGGTVIEGDARVGGSAQLVRSVVWPGTRVADGVELDECIVAGGVSLPLGFRARHAVLVPEALAGDGEPVGRRGGVAVYSL